MGNCISKISKDPLLAFEEFMKNKTFFEKGRIRPSLDRLTGETYTRIHSIKGFQRKKLWPRYKLGCGGQTFFYKKQVYKTNLKSLEVVCKTHTNPVSYHAGKAVYIYGPEH